MSNPPHRHHYIPSFYLSRWALQEGGQLCQYSRPYNRIVPNRKHPDATGYLDKLYEMTGLDGPIAQVLETNFFSPVDSAAAEALAILETQGNAATWTDRPRAAWSQFLHSLLLRMPEDLALFKASWRRLMVSDTRPEWEEKYQKSRGPNDPSTLREYMENVPEDFHSRSALHALATMMTSSSIGGHISNMLWWVVEAQLDDYPFLTSDRPIIRSNGLRAENGHIAMPIGPHKLFVAAKDYNVLRSIVEMHPRRLVRECNRQVVRHAEKYVYGIDDRQLAFVAKHFNKDPDPRLIESTVRGYESLEERMIEHLMDDEEGS